MSAHTHVNTYGDKSADGIQSSVYESMDWTHTTSDVRRVQIGHEVVKQAQRQPVLIHYLPNNLSFYLIFESIHLCLVYQEYVKY